MKSEITWDTLQALLNSPIAFHRIFATIGGGATAGLFLSQLFYWTPRSRLSGGWVYKTVIEWEEETALTRYEQEGIRKKLVKAGLIEVDRRGVPATLHFRIVRDRFLEAISDAAMAKTLAESQIGENQQTEIGEKPKSRGGKTSKLDRGKTTNKNAENQQTITETTAETSSKNTSEISFFRSNGNEQKKRKKSAIALEEEKPTPQQQDSTQSSTGKVDRETDSPPQPEFHPTQTEGATQQTESGTPSPFPLPQRGATRSQNESVKGRHPWRDGRSVDPKFALFIGKQLPKGKNDGSMSSQTKGRKYVLNSEASDLGLDKLWGDWEDYLTMLEKKRSNEVADAPSSGRFDRSSWKPKPDEKVVFMDTDYIFQVKAAIERGGVKFISDLPRTENFALEEQGEQGRWFELSQCIPYS